MSAKRVCMFAALLACVGCASDESTSIAGPAEPQLPGIPSQGRNFGQLRAIIAAGEVPAPSVLSLEIFLDEHKQPAGKRLCAAPLCLNASSGMGPDLRTGIPRRWIAITLQPGAARPAARADRLVIAVDTSSSMAGPSMEALRRALRPLGDSAGALTLQLVSFGDEVVVHAPVSAQDRSAWRAQVDALEARGASDLQGGLRAALQQALADGEAPGRVLFVADGTANTGITSEQRLLELARSYSAAGVELSTLGLGSDFPSQLLHTLQRSSLGSFYHIDDLTELSAALEREVGTRRVRLGSDITLLSTQRAAVIAAYGAELSEVSGDTLQIRLNAAGVEQRGALEQARIAAGANVLLVELAPARVAQDTAQLTLDYRDAERRPGSDSLTVVGLQSWERAALRGEWSDVSVERYATVISVHDALRVALEDYARGDARGAARELTRFIGALEEWLRDRDEQDIYQDLLLLRQLADTIRLRAGSFE